MKKMITLAAFAVLTTGSLAFAQSAPIQNPNNCTPASANCQANHKTPGNEPGPASHMAIPEQRAAMPGDAAMPPSGGSGATAPLKKPGEGQNPQQGG